MDNYAAALNERGKGCLPGHLGLEWTEGRAGFVAGRMLVQPHHLAPNGYLHAASVIALADTACGYGAILSKPDAAIGFTTIEIEGEFSGDRALRRDFLRSRPGP